MVFNLSIFNKASDNIYASNSYKLRKETSSSPVSDSLFGENFEQNYTQTNPSEMKPANQVLFLSKTCDIKSVANSMIKIIDAKDSYTGKHSKAVQKYANTFSKALGLPEPEQELISIGSAFHDIGKIGVSESILNSNSSLTEEQFNEIKKHPEIGSKILEEMPAFKGPVSNIVKQHHEHWDGTGYPEGLSGDKISTGARIVSIVDSYHAMVSDRPYRQGMAKEKAAQILNDGAGKQWDPALIKEFSKIIPLI